MHVPLSGLVLHHRGRCQYHSGTSSVLGTSQSSWKWSKASFIDSHLKIRPIDEVARGGSIGHISDRGVSVSGSNAAGNGAPSLLQSLGSRIGLRSKRAPETGPDSMWIGPLTTLLISRREPRLLCVLQPDEDQVLLLHAPTPQEAIRWVGTIASCIVAHRTTAPPRSQLLEVVMSRGGLVGFQGEPLPDDDAGSMSSPQVFLRDPADISRRGRLEVIHLLHGRVSTRLGLPTLSENLWETREIQLEWFGMLVSHRWFAGRAFLNNSDLATSPQSLLRSFKSSFSLAGDPRHLVGRHGAAEEPSKGDEADTTGHTVSIDFSAEEVALYAIPDDPLVLALRHGPEEQLLLMRAQSAEEASAWGHDLASCLALCRGDDYVILEAGDETAGETDLDDAGLAADAADADEEQGLHERAHEHDPSEQSDRRPAATSASALKRTALQAGVAAAASAANVVVFSEI